MTDRTRCLAPEACGTGTRLCQSCRCRLRMAQIKADPEAFAAWKEKTGRRWRDPDAVAARMVSFKGNRAGLRRIAAAGRRHMKAINADPEIMQRRLDAMRASVAGRVRRNAERLASRVGIPVELVDTYRLLRRKKFASSEAAAQLEAMHPAAFVEIAAARRRALGPMPAIGTEELRAWRRKAAETRT